MEVLALPSLKTVTSQLILESVFKLEQLLAPLLGSVNSLRISSARELTSLCGVGLKASGLKGSIVFSDAAKLVYANATSTTHTLLRARTCASKKACARARAIYMAVAGCDCRTCV